MSQAVLAFGARGGKIIGSHDSHLARTRVALGEDAGIVVDGHARAQLSECGLVSQQPGNARGHNNLGPVLHDADRLEEAAGHYRTALQIEPVPAGTRHKQGDVLRESREPDRAVASSEQTPRLKPGSSDADRLVISRYYDVRAFSDVGGQEVGVPHHVLALVAYGHIPHPYLFSILTHPHGRSHQVDPFCRPRCPLQELLGVTRRAHPCKVL